MADEEAAEETPEESASAGRGRGFLLAAFIAVALILPLLRLSSLVTWPWLMVLAPWTLAGVVLLGRYVVSFLRRTIEAIRAQADVLRDATPGTTLPPSELEAPLVSDDPSDRILAQHPELLAALCLGFRMKRLQPNILGKSVNDPWGVYQRALSASSLEFDEVRHLAKKHARAYASTAKTTLRKPPSDAMVSKRAADHFRRCAEKTAKRGGNPDCPFEHVTVVYGIRIPSRDATLRSLAPRVRSLLEQQYPQLATATLSDGSHVKYEAWQQQAAEGRKELARIKRDSERLTRTLDETQAALAQARSESAALHDQMERYRQETREAARLEQEQLVSELRSAIDRSAATQARDLQRLNAEMAKQEAAIALMAAERDELERAMLSVTDESGESGTALDEATRASLVGLRVLLVGGDARMVIPLREHAEGLGIQLLHDDTMNAAQLVAGVDVVVFWIRYLSHPKYFGVRRECRVLGTNHCYWARTSSASLVETIVVARGGERLLPSTG